MTLKVFCRHRRRRRRRRRRHRVQFKWILCLVLNLQDKYVANAAHKHTHTHTYTGAPPSCRKHRFLCKTTQNDTSPLSSASTLSFLWRSKSQKMRPAVSILCVFICGKPISSVLRLVFMCYEQTAFMLFAILHHHSHTKASSHRKRKKTKILDYFFALTATQIFIILKLRILHWLHAAASPALYRLGRIFDNCILYLILLFRTRQEAHLAERKV